MACPCSTLLQHHLPSPLCLSSGTETSGWEKCHSSSSISKVTAWTSSNTLTCLTVLLRWGCYFSEMETRVRKQRWECLPHLPVPWAGCLCALTSMASSAVKCSPLMRTQLGHEMVHCRLGTWRAMLQAWQVIAVFWSRDARERLKMNQRHWVDWDCLASFPPSFITCLVCIVHTQSLLIYYI